MLSAGRGHGCDPLGSKSKEPVQIAPLETSSPGQHRYSNVTENHRISAKNKKSETSNMEGRSSPSLSLQLAMVGHTCHPRTGEVEAGRTGVQGQPGLHSEFMAKQHKPLKSETKLLLDTAGLKC